VSSLPSWKSVEFSLQLAGVGIFWPRTQGQTCQDLATYNINTVFHKENPVGFPSCPTGFFWTLHSAQPTGHSFDPVGSFSCFFLILFFKGKKQPKSNKKKILLCKSTMLYKTCKFLHQLNILSRFPQKAKLAPIKEKCKSSRGRALKTFLSI